MPTSGSKVLTASGELSTSGKPVRIHNLSFINGLAGALELYTGTSKTGTAVVSLTGTAQRSVVQNFENGLLFSTGCYVNFVGISAACVEFSLEV